LELGAQKSSNTRPLKVCIGARPKGSSCIDHACAAAEGNSTAASTRPPPS
jgi:hypothetical protein